MNGNTPRIEQETTVKNLIETYPEVLLLFQQNFIGNEFPDGFNCRQCPLAEEETLEQAARAHGIDIDGFLEMLTEFVDKTEPNQRQ